MTHYMKLHNSPFEMIAKGYKTFELRLYDKKRKLIKEGDEIIFSCTGDKDKTLHTQVVAIHLFPDFNELYSSLPLEKCGYLSSEIDKASPKDMDVYYSPDEQSAYGVVAIEIKLI